jgi:hypothetical protein
MNENIQWFDVHKSIDGKLVCVGLSIQIKGEDGKQSKCIFSWDDIKTFGEIFLMRKAENDQKYGYTASGSSDVNLLPSCVS